MTRVRTKQEELRLRIAGMLLLNEKKGDIKKLFVNTTKTQLSKEVKRVSTYGSVGRLAKFVADTVWVAARHAGTVILADKFISAIVSSTIAFYTHHPAAQRGEFRRTGGYSIAQVANFAAANIINLAIQMMQDGPAGGGPATHNDDHSYWRGVNQQAQMKGFVEKLQQAYVDMPGERLGLGHDNTATLGGTRLARHELGLGRRIADAPNTQEFQEAIGDFGMWLVDQNRENRHDGTELSPLLGNTVAAWRGVPPEKAILTYFSTDAIFQDPRKILRAIETFVQRDPNWMRTSELVTELITANVLKADFRTDNTARQKRKLTNAVINTMAAQSPGGRIRWWDIESNFGYLLRLYARQSMTVGANMLEPSDTRPDEHRYPTGWLGAFLTLTGTYGSDVWSMTPIERKDAALGNVAYRSHTITFRDRNGQMQSHDISAKAGIDTDFFERVLVQIGPESVEDMMRSAFNPYDGPYDDATHRGQLVDATHAATRSYAGGGRLSMLGGLVRTITHGFTPSSHFMTRSVSSITTREIKDFVLSGAVQTVDFGRIRNALFLSGVVTRSLAPGYDPPPASWFAALNAISMGATVNALLENHIYTGPSIAAFNHWIKDRIPGASIVNPTRIMTYMTTAAAGSVFQKGHQDMYQWSEELFLEWTAEQDINDLWGVPDEAPILSSMFHEHNVDYASFSVSPYHAAGSESIIMEEQGQQPKETKMQIIINNMNNEIRDNKGDYVLPKFKLYTLNRKAKIVFDGKTPQQVADFFSNHTAAIFIDSIGKLDSRDIRQYPNGTIYNPQDMDPTQAGITSEQIEAEKSEVGLFISSDDPVKLDEDIVDVEETGTPGVVKEPKEELRI